MGSGRRRRLRLHRHAVLGVGPFLLGDVPSRHPHHSVEARHLSDRRARHAGVLLAVEQPDPARGEVRRIVDLALGRVCPESARTTARSRYARTGCRPRGPRRRSSGCRRTGAAARGDMELMREEGARRDTGDRDARRIELAVGRERRDRNSGVLGKACRRHKREEKRAQAQSFCEGRFVMTNRRSLSAGGRGHVKLSVGAGDVTNGDAGHGQGGPPKGPAGPRSARPPEPTDTLNCRVSSGFRPAPRPEITREADALPHSSAWRWRRSGCLPCS